MHAAQVLALLFFGSTIVASQLLEPFDPFDWEIIRDTSSPVIQGILEEITPSMELAHRMILARAYKHKEVVGGFVMYRFTFIVHGRGQPCMALVKYNAETGQGATLHHTC